MIRSWLAQHDTGDALINCKFNTKSWVRKIIFRKNKLGWVTEAEAMKTVNEYRKKSQRWTHEQEGTSPTLLCYRDQLLRSQQ